MHSLLSRTLVSFVLGMLAWPTLAQVTEHKLTASDGAVGDRFGYSVAISGDYALIGAYADDDLGENSGAAYMFERQADGSWLEVAKLTASNGDPEDKFGYSVSIWGDRALVDGDFYFSNHGDEAYVYVFERQGDGSWLEVDRIEGDADDQFGFAVSLWEDRAMIGAPRQSEGGEAYVYERQPDGSWIVGGTMSTGPSYYYGEVVSIYEDNALVVNPFSWDEEPIDGSVDTYIRDENGTWISAGGFGDHDGDPFDRVGSSMSVFGNRALVGAIGDNDHGEYSGAVYVLELQEDDRWTDVAKLFPFDVAAGSFFGRSASLSGEQALVGAYDPGSGLGAVYVHRRQENGEWLNVAKFMASVGTEDDAFGGAVSLSGGRILVGAYKDDDLGELSGAAYLYDELSDLLPPSEAPDLLSPSDGAVFESGNVTFSWTTDPDPTYYRLEISTTLGFESPILTTVAGTSYIMSPYDLPANHPDPLYWRVRGGNAGGEGPNSVTRTFTYNVLGWIAGGGGIIEVRYANDDATCPDPSNPDDYGCTVLFGDGNTVWHDGNLNDDYYVSAGGSPGDVGRINRYIEAAVPDAFEIRFSPSGGLALYGFGGLFEIASVPFRIWNIRETPDDPTDDVRMIPFLNINVAPQDDWENQFTGTDEWSDSPCSGGCPITDWVYFMMPDRPDGYDLFEQAAMGFGGAGAIYDPTSDGDSQIDLDPLTGLACGNQGVYVDYCYRNQDFVNNEGPSDQIYPLGRVVFADLAGDGTTPPVGTGIRFMTTIPPIVTDELDPAADELPREYALLPVYPNPFNPRAIVPFTVPKTGPVRVVVYDILGREVAVLVSGQIAAGGHEVVLDGGNLASGIYLIRLEAGGLVHARQKVLLLR